MDTPPISLNTTFDHSSLIVLRKTIKVVKGELELFDDVRYFFYITNDWHRSTAEMIAFYRNRSDHENDIEQLKNGVQALNTASDSLMSNWALMVSASLAWVLKAWFGLLMSYRPAIPPSVPSRVLPWPVQCRAAAESDHRLEGA